MPTAEVNIELYCATCGEGLCNQSEFSSTRHRNEPSFRIDACGTCLEKARDEGYSEGYDKGVKDAEA